jgi:putative endonuclease
VVRENRRLGESGEMLARKFLAGQGYRILECNYKTAQGEIDIIAKDGRTLCFIEVKTRRDGRCGIPSESVHRSKQFRISSAALRYLQSNKLLQAQARFDVVSIEYAQGKPRVALIRNAFELDTRYTY